MQYFTVQTEYNAYDLCEKLLGYGSDQTDNIIELVQEFSLESELLDLVDVNIGENVELHEITQDIQDNMSEYVEHLRKNMEDHEEWEVEEFEERIKDLGL